MFETASWIPIKLDTVVDTTFIVLDIGAVSSNVIPINVNLLLVFPNVCYVRILL